METEIISPVPAELGRLRLNGRAYGIMLTMTTLLTMVFVFHWPMSGLKDAAALGELTIAVTVFITIGISGFAFRLGIEHPLVIGGWLCYLIGAVALIFAALIIGFILPIVARPDTASLAVSALTRLGFILVSVSSLLWAHALMHHKGKARLVAVMGILAGGISLALSVKADNLFLPQGLLSVMAPQALWNMTIATWMIRGMKA